LKGIECKIHLKVDILLNTALFKPFDSFPFFSNQSKNLENSFFFTEIPIRKLITERNLPFLATPMGKGGKLLKYICQKYV